MAVRSNSGRGMVVELLTALLRRNSERVASKCDLDQMSCACLVAKFRSEAIKKAHPRASKAISVRRLGLQGKLVSRIWNGNE